MTRIDGEPNCGQFAATILPLKDMDGDGIQDLAVSAVHADGDPWPMTGKIFLFSGNTLIAGTAVDDAITIPGVAKDMHLGAFLTVIGERMWLVAGAPTEKANTGSVRIFDLNDDQNSARHWQTRSLHRSIQRHRPQVHGSGNK